MRIEPAAVQPQSRPTRTPRVLDAEKHVEAAADDVQVDEYRWHRRGCEHTGEARGADSPAATEYAHHDARHAARKSRAFRDAFHANAICGQKGVCGQEI
jgi:hypothetical protein